MNTNKTELIDGEILHILDKETWEVVIQDMVFEGIPVLSLNLRDWVKYRLDFVQHNKEFELALYDPKIFKSAWWVCVLLKTEFGLQRVHIEHLQCEICEWYGATANPMDSDLYYGTSDKWAALKAAEIHKVVPCPKCGNKLPRHPIWVEPIADSDAPKV